MYFKLKKVQWKINEVISMMGLYLFCFFQFLQKVSCITDIIHQHIGWWRFRWVEWWLYPKPCNLPFSQMLTDEWNTTKERPCASAQGGKRQQQHEGHVTGNIECHRLQRVREYSCWIHTESTHDCNRRRRDTTFLWLDDAVMWPPKYFQVCTLYFSDVYLFSRQCAKAFGEQRQRKNYHQVQWHRGASVCDAHLEELREHEAAGNLYGVDLQGRATVIDARVTGAGTNTKHHRLGGTQQLVVHLI